MNGYTFRRARLEDTGALQALQAACFAPKFHDDEQTIRECIASDLLLVAERAGELAGAVVVTARPELAGQSPWHLYAIEVAPRHRRRGLAAELVRRALKELPAGTTLTATPVTPAGAGLVASLGLRVTANGAN